MLGRDKTLRFARTERRAALIYEQSILVEFEPDLAFKTLPDLLPDMEERRQAIQVVKLVAGAIEEIEPKTIQVVQRFRNVPGPWPRPSYRNH